jgi:hypothetical protein
MIDRKKRATNAERPVAHHHNLITAGPRGPQPPQSPSRCLPRKGKVCRGMTEVPLSFFDFAPRDRL